MVYPRKITLRITEKHYEELVEIAEKKNISIAEAIKYAIERYFMPESENYYKYKE